MSAVVTVILTALQLIMSILGNTGLGTSEVDKVINFLVGIIPLVEKEAETVAPYIKNIIAALRSNSATTVSQLAQLATLDAQADAAFAEAAKAADAADAAAAAGSAE